MTTDAGSWQVIRHDEFAEWADEVLNDNRQVYARDVTQPEDAPLVFMDDGQADRFRVGARADELICPVPGCPSPTLTTRGPDSRRHHFMHRHAPEDPAHNLAHRRRVAVRLLRDWVAAQRADYAIEEGARVGGVTTTLLVRSPTGHQLAIFYVDQRFGAQRWESEYHRLKRVGMPGAWVFGLRKGFFALPKPPSGAPPDHPVARDRGRGNLILDKPMYRAMSRAGVWPLLFSTERRQLANVIPPDGEPALRLGLPPPASLERVLHLVPNPLDLCRLGRYGIATPAVGPDLLELAWKPKPPTPLVTLRRLASTPPERPERPRRPALPTMTPEELADYGRRVLAVMPVKGPTVLNALIRDLNAVDDERRLRVTLHSLRAGGHLRFGDPLGYFNAISRATP
jgi:hypothetical protein